MIALHQAWLSKREEVRKHQKSFQDEKIDGIVDTSEHTERRVKQSGKGMRLNY